MLPYLRYVYKTTNSIKLHTYIFINTVFQNIFKCQFLEEVTHRFGLWMNINLSNINQCFHSVVYVIYYYPLFFSSQDLYSGGAQGRQASAPVGTRGRPISGAGAYRQPSNNPIITRDDKTGLTISSSRMVGYML